MISVDYVFIGLILLCIAVGAVIGFGKGLQLFACGIVGIIISIISCYFLFGLVLSFEFVQGWITKLTDYLSAVGSPICKFLLAIKIELIVVAIVLFILVQVSRKLLVVLVASIFEANNIVFKVINKALGAILCVVVFICLSLIVMQIMFMAGADGNALFEGSFFKLDWIFFNNPLTSIIKI